jgi:hypothetical protein
MFVRLTALKIAKNAVLSCPRLTMIVRNAKQPSMVSNTRILTVMFTVLTTVQMGSIQMELIAFSQEMANYSV